MVNFYVYLIQMGKMKVEEVPKLWKEKVRKIIEGSAQ